MISNSTIIFEKIDDAKKKMEITGSNAISLNEYFHPELLHTDRVPRRFGWY
jgi:hypothetical protein